MGKFIVRRVKGGVKFDLKARNGVTVATSEVYLSRNSCLSGIQSVMKNAPVACIEDHTEAEFARQKNPKFELYQDKSGEYRFRLKALNGQIIAVSEGYVAKASCGKGIESARKSAVNAAILFIEE